MEDFVIVDVVETSKRDRHFEIVNKANIQRVIPLINVSNNSKYDACQIYIDGFEEPIEVYGSIFRLWDKIVNDTDDKES